MNGSAGTAPGQTVDLRREVDKRKTWFYECQLRGLNFDTFRGINEAFPDPRLGLITEPLFSWGFPAGQFGQLKNLGPVYLDDQAPVWTPDEFIRRGAFAKEFIGRHNNWLGYKSGQRLAAALADLKQKYEESVTASRIDLAAEINLYPRHPPGEDAGSTGRALSRATLAEAKPWLIPELYNTKDDDKKSPIENWIDSLQAFIDGFEADLVIAVGGTPSQPNQPTLGGALTGEAYRAFIKLLIEASSTRNAAGSLKAKMLTRVKSPNGKSSTYQYEDINVQTNGYPMGPLSKFPFSPRLQYWTSVLKPALGECYVNKPNADMGLCHIMRTVYLLGALPATLGSAADLKWRTRAAPDDTFTSFFDKMGQDQAVKDNETLRTRLKVAQDKLRVILEETALHPHGPSATFSPLAQEIVRQALHSFKFWLDEPLHVSSNGELLKARQDTKIVTSDKELKAEMEYWSENHYIMFASSEFLAGQLWEADEFLPGVEFFDDPTSKSGLLTGGARKARGKARLLKWLNNRLMFGWMEFNSSGYYREHLWSLLNLVDFSLDHEVRDKAAVAVDLLLFDVARFLHKGTMGAAGGRSQFNSKGSGWNNALGDVVEILFGTRGLFTDLDGQIGASMSTTTYQVPEVLLEIGTHPPETPFTDRSRVSISFDEAPKYGIGYSKESEQKDSVMAGYAPKRARYSPFLDKVNQDIARTHTSYGGTDDDTIFWWGASAFYSNQTVRGTFKAVTDFALQESPVFTGALPTLIKVVAAFEKLKHRGLLGGIVGTVFGGVGTGRGAALGAIEGGIEVLGESFFKDHDLLRNLEEAATDDLSVLLEGSIRTRANLLSFRNRDAMLSSIQNFRPGQLNFQSSVCQAALNPSVSVFVTAGLDELDINGLEAALGGGLFGAALGTALSAATGGAGGVLVAAFGVAGAIVGVAATRGLELSNHDDGPGWWTGSWALPMVAQHDSAAILAYDFHRIQDLLAESASHVWFPKAGFDRVDEVRTSAYDDANFALLDIGDIGPKGFWLFGKIVHPPDGSTPPGEPREGYIGVFSNQRPKWLDQGSDFYKKQLDKAARTPIKEKQQAFDDLLDEIEHSPLGGADAKETIEAAVTRAVDDAFRPGISRDDWLKGAIGALSKISTLNVPDFPILALNLTLPELLIDLKILQSLWPDPLPLDYFAEKDWYVEGKNVWIVQVGSREEFGDFQGFKDRVSSARVHLDDSGDLECSYDIPRAGGGSERLTLAYGDGGRFSLNGRPFQTDLYPRFENPFLRGGRVEWGQREYVIEYRGRSLLHDLHDFSLPQRDEHFAADANDRNTIKALVIFLTTGDEDMDAFTVATASVSIGCSQATEDQVVAAGPAGEKTVHDAEWIFFDSPSLRNPDMTLSLSHPASSKGDDTPHWKMSFTLRALMGDRSLRDCSVSFSYFDFVNEKRDSIPFPFSVSLSEWRAWEQIEDNKTPSVWMIARHPDFSKYYYDYHDLVALDQDGRLWHRKLKPCKAADKGWFPITQGGSKGPDLSRWFSASAVSAQPGNLFLFVQGEGRLFASWPSPSGEWSADWITVAVYIYPDIFGIPDTNAAQIPVTLASSSTVVGVPSSLSTDGAEIYVLGGDGHFYSHADWHTNDTGPWRKLDVTGFTALLGADFAVVGDFLFVLASDRALWAAALDHSTLHGFPSWEKVTATGMSVSRFTATCENGVCQIVAATTEGRVWVASYGPGNPPVWIEANLPDGTVSAAATLTSAVSSAGHAEFFALGTDGKVYTIGWESARGWTADRQWSAVQPESQGFVPLAGGMTAISRVNGQIELFTQGVDNELFKAWWS